MRGESSQTYLGRNMGKASRERASKACGMCESIAHSVLYRVKAMQSQAWIFACKPCQERLKQHSGDYQYGGTWKQNKRN